ncbi:MAG: undecaprenyldiphospho-muramoylpentapeptide beta-N-acetylglucosaminyltransferase [Gammaproteobacteria bacterium]|nr:undecaprenyldiphospho-muramoylpentapeptide beta-N-acetylglucosaminyltransferase [Gammaproteobacteria bacterium]
MNAVTQLQAGSILVMAGGTGGHVFPALSVADVLRAEGWQVTWLGTRRGIEARLVPAAGIDIEWLDVSALRGKGVASLLLAPFKLLRACWQAGRVIRRINPDVVLGMGGFAAGPGGLVAKLLGRPLVIHEQNAVAGLTNRVLSKFADQVLVAFPGALSGRNVRSIGNPVRKDLQDIAPPEERFAGRSGSLRLLVVGGSQGARVLNEMLPAALSLLDVDVTVRHQCGRDNAPMVEARYADAGIDASVEPFIDDMAAAYAWADLAICRAGAMTVFELATVGLGAVLVPYPHAVDDHQTANANYLAAVDAAEIIREDSLDANSLAGSLRSHLGSRQDLLAMAVAARGMAQPRADRELAAVCAALHDTAREAA